MAGIDGYLYMLGSDTTGFKLARVPISSMTNRAQVLFPFLSWDSTPSLPPAPSPKKKSLLTTHLIQYTYYSKATGKWTSTPAKLNDPSANILNFTADQFGVKLSVFSSDLWFDPYHQTAVIVFMDGGIDGTFRASYSTNNALEGPWSDPVEIYTASVPDYCKNQTGLIDVYDGHALHGWDPSGKTLLLSYSSCAAVVEMALLTWA